MTTPINLNKIRKARAKAEAEQRAGENRVKFGRTKSEKKLEVARADRQAKLNDAHKRERPVPESD